MDKHIAIKISNTDNIVGYLKISANTDNTKNEEGTSNKYTILPEDWILNDSSDEHKNNKIKIELLNSSTSDNSQIDSIAQEFYLDIDNISQFDKQSSDDEIQKLKTLVAEYEQKTLKLKELEDMVTDLDETKAAYNNLKLEFDKVVENLEAKKSQIGCLEAEIAQLKSDNIENSHDEKFDDLNAQIKQLLTENSELKDQNEKYLKTIQEQNDVKNKDLEQSQNGIHTEIKQLKNELHKKEQELQETKDKASKTSMILTQSLEKFKNKESTLQKSLEELDNVKQLCNQQDVEISELKKQLNESLNNGSERTEKNKVSEVSGQMDEEQKNTFASMVQMSLEKLKIVSKILNSKNPKPGAISSSLEKLKGSVVEKRNEEDSLAEFEKKLKTHFWNIHEVYLSILIKQTKKNESFYEEIDQMKTQSSRSTHKLNYIEDLVKKFIQLDNKEKIHKDILMAMIDVFITKPEDKATFFKNLKLIHNN